MSRDPIIIKTPHEIEIMRKAGAITAGARSVARAAIADGLTTKQVNREVNDFIIKSRAIPTFKGYGGFPASTCISINEEVIHGIPGKRVIHNGDIVSVDVGATFGGFVGDCAGTYPCGEISEQAKKLIEVTRQSFYEGLKFARAGYRIDDIGSAIQEYAESHGFGVVRDYVGHGVGRNMHEAPEVPNYSIKGKRANPRLVAGMTIAIEPMITLGKPAVRTLSDGWTVKTRDGSLAAHFEHTIAITPEGAVILTLPE